MLTKNKKLKKYQTSDAIKKLTELGLFESVKDLELYHGRANNNGTEWEVDPGFNNGGNATGHNNVNTRSVLYTSDKDTADAFADKRSIASRGKAETHRIVSKHNDALVLNVNFDYSKLDKKQKDEFVDAMGKLELSVTNNLPVLFEYKFIMPYIMNAIFDVIDDKIKARKNLTTEYLLLDNEDSKKILKKLSHNENFIKVKEHLIKNGLSGAANRFDFAKLYSENNINKLTNNVISAFNMQRLMKVQPERVLRYFIKGRTDIGVGNKTIFLNEKYIFAWCKNNKVIGLKQSIFSATLQEPITSYSIFDLAGIETETANQVQSKNIDKKYGSLRENFRKNKLSKDEKFMGILSNGSAKEIMDFVCENKKLKQLFECNDGNWENYSIKQHTTAVLDFYDNYYSNRIPQEAENVLKLAIIAHDIGKGIFRSGKSEYSNQKEANLNCAQELYKQYNIDERYQNLVNFIMGEGQNFTSNYYFGIPNGTKEKVQENKDKILNGFAISTYKVLTKFLGRKPEYDEIDSIITMCTYLQHCDSGAYTYYAKVFDEKTGLYSTGGSQNFTNSFKVNKYGKPELMEK